MKIEKVTEEQWPEAPVFDESIFPPPVKVQGSELQALDNMMLLNSRGRFKFYTEGCDYVRVLAGSGHIKWARGEFPFREGDLLKVEGVKEYELNGKGRFFVVRR